MISFSSKGNFSNIEKFLAAMKRKQYLDVLNDYGAQGVAALSAATPKDSGRTSESWTYEIEQSLGSSSIYWSNTNINEGVNIAVIIQYGHGTGSGGYVAGRDYINPSIRPIFDSIAEAAWKEVQSS
jgi:hypothetical protein